MDRELIPLEETGVSLAVRGANIPKDLTIEQAGDAIAILSRLRGTAYWALADLIAESAGRWGSMYDQLIEATQMSQGTLANMLSVWRRFPEQADRMWDLSPSHYAAVAVNYIDDETRAAILQQAFDEGLSRDRVRDIMRGYGPNVVTPVFSKEAFVTRLEMLINWAEANDAPDELMEVVREFFNDFKKQPDWTFSDSPNDSR